METLQGLTLGRYRILRRIGAGGMSNVYAATDVELGRDVALKVLKPEHAKGEAAERRRVRLLREAQALALVSHPNVVRVFEAGAFGDQVYIAMELIEGESLRDWLARGPRSRADILAVFAAAGRGLEAAHAAGLVHRDFKPGNVLIGRDGRVVVTDFGLVRLGPQSEDAATRALPAGAAESSHEAGVLAIPLTIPGAVLGTPGYMAPEQIQGRAADGRTDQFGFVVALYEALYGELPFSFEVEGLPPEMAIALEVVQGRVRPPPPGSQVPERIRAVLVRALSVEPDARFESMGALLDAMRAAHITDLAGRTASSDHHGRWVPQAVVASWSASASAPAVTAVEVSRASWIALALGALMLVAGAGAYTYVYAERGREAPRDPNEGPIAAAVAAANEGAALAERGELAAAIAAYERALPALEASLGAESPEVGEVLLGLAGARRRSGATDAALAELRRASAFSGETEARAAFALGDLLLELGRTREARPPLERALALSEGGDAAFVADVLADLGIAAAMEGDAGAVSLLERALAAAASPAVAPHRRARVRFALARVLGASEGGASRAVELARAARAELGSSASAERAAIDAWLQGR